MNHTREGAAALSFIGALAAVFAMAALRGVFGDQIANCAALLLLWRILYLAMRPEYPKKRGRYSGRRR